MYKVKAFFDRYVASHMMLRRHFVLAFLKMSRDKNLQDFWRFCTTWPSLCQGLLPTIRNFENRRGEGPGDEVVFAANNILLMRNSNHARSLWSLLCEMEDRDRFPKLPESELTSLLDQKNSDNDKKATKVALNVFTEAKAELNCEIYKS